MRGVVERAALLDSVTSLQIICRMESDDDSDSPDNIVPASSPESVLGEEMPRFPLLSGPKFEMEERSLSPVIPIIPKASIPGLWSYGVMGGEACWEGGICQLEFKLCN